jgi:hypothetical protein
MVWRKNYLRLIISKTARHTEEVYWTQLDVSFIFPKLIFETFYAEMKRRVLHASSVRDEGT